MFATNSLTVLGKYIHMKKGRRGREEGQKSIGNTLNVEGIQQFFVQFCKFLLSLKLC